MCAARQSVFNDHNLGNDVTLISFFRRPHLISLWIIENKVRPKKYCNWSDYWIGECWKARTHGAYWTFKPFKPVCDLFAAKKRSTFNLFCLRNFRFWRNFLIFSNYALRMVSPWYCRVKPAVRHCLGKGRYEIFRAWIHPCNTDFLPPPIFHVPASSATTLK